MASEAAAWTCDELREALAEAGLDGLTHARDRSLGLYQAWWAPRLDARGPAVPWTRPALPPDAAFWADRITAGMTDTPP